MSASGTANSTLIYGASGTYKTTQVLALAEWIYASSGLRTRVISAETAGAETLSPGIALGFIEPLWISQDMLPRSAMRKLARGEWPVMKDGIPIRSDKGEMKWTLSLEGVGAYAWEGLTSISMVLSQGLKSKFASGTSVKGGGVEGAGLAGAGYTEDGETFGSGSQSQVGSVQDTIMEILRESPKNLFVKSGGKIAHVLFTAHEARGTDELTAQSVYGPGTLGKALTGKISAEVGTCLHLESEIIQIPAKGPDPAHSKQKVWAYFRPHPDAENSRINWPAKPRVPPIKEALEALDKKFPGGRFELTTAQSIVDYLQFQDEARESSMKVLEARRSAMQSAQKPANPSPVNAGAAVPAVVK